jgi:hypothetical protein
MSLTLENRLRSVLDDCGEKQMKHLEPFLEDVSAILQRYKPA